LSAYSALAVGQTKAPRSALGAPTSPTAWYTAPMGRHFLISAALCSLACLACEDGSSLSALSPELAPLPDVIDFGQVYVGAEGEHSLVLKNTGAGSLLVQDVQVQGSGFEVGAFDGQVGPGNQGQASLRFVPRGPGRVEGQVAITVPVLSDVPFIVALVGEALAPISCDDSNPCTAEAFDPKRGECIRTELEGPCDDGSACTERDRCSAGECIGRAINCDDGVDCTQDLCDPQRGCVAVGDDSQCVDEDPCTIDRCGDSGCENPSAPDGHVCGDVVACQTAEICVLRQCITVSIPEGAPCDDGQTCTLDDQCTAGVCTGTGTTRAPIVRAKTTMVDNTISGTLLDSHIYVSTPVASAQRFKVMEVDGHFAAPVEAVPTLDGTAELHPVGDGIYARVRTSTAIERLVDVLDAQQPGQPVLLGTYRVGYDSDADATATSTGTRFYFCSAPSQSVASELTVMDFATPLQPSAPIRLGAAFCGARNGQRFTSGALWGLWRNDRAGGQASVDAYRLGATSIDRLISHSYVTDGVSSYGAIEHVATDGQTLILDLERPHTFLVFLLDPVRVQQWTVTLRGTQPLFLLALHGQTAYFGDADRLVAYGLSDPSQPQLLPDSIQFPNYVTPFVRVLDADDTRMLVQDSRGLRLFRRTAFGLADAFVVRGTGGLGQTTLQPSGLISASTRGVTLIAPASLPISYLPATPTSHLVVQTAPQLIDGPDGPAMLHSPLLVPGDQACSPFQWGCDRTQPTPIDYELGTTTLLPDGTATSTPTVVRMSSQPVAVAAIEGCIGAGFDDHTRASRYVVLDRCVSPDHIQIIGELPATVPAGEATVWTRTKIHDGGFASFLGRSFAVLFDYRVPVAPLVEAEEFLQPGASGGFLGSAFDGTHWVLTWLDDTGAPWLKVLQVGSGAPTETARAAILPAEGQPLRNVLGLRWPLLYVGAERGGASVLLVYDLDQAVPEVVHTVPLDSPAIGFVDGGDELYFVRADGLTVVEPACTP